ncbi:MAG: ATP-binding protein, partial [Bdellovibrionales bacterium]
MAVNLLKKWLGTLALFACAACHLVYAEGVAELTVRGGHNAVDLYVVAYKTSSGNASSSLEPGIHALVRGQDKATLLIKGQVLGASRGFNGVFALADLHRYTGRAESFAVVDGKMIVFSNKTKSNRQDSKIVLGSKQNPVVDILNRRNVPLALITNVNDVSMAQHNLAPQGELFLISLRQANPFGPGITIALMLKRPTSQDAAGVLETIGQPVVVDYDFYTNKELLQLMHDEARDKVLSPAHLLHYMQRLPDDDRILREWRSNIESVYKRVKKDRKEVAGSKKTAAQREAEAQRQATIPYYSMIQNRVVFDQLPHAMLSRNPLGIFQLTNPISTSGGIGSSLVIRNPQVDPDDTIKPNTQATTQGRVDYDEHTKAYRVYPIVSDVEENPAMIAVVDGRSKILFQGDYSDKYISVVDISTLLPADFRQIQAVHTKAPLEGTRIIRHYFFISHTTRDSGAQTDVILCEERDGVVKFERRLALNRRLMSTKELNARIVVKTDADDGIPTGAVLFDDVSSSEKVQRRRTKMENLTTPLLDINATRSSETVRQTYLNALQTLDLIEGQLEHRRYNPTGVKQSQTGFYYHRIPNPHNDPKIEINFVPAEILKPENDKRAKATLDSKTIRDKAGPDKPPMFVVSAYAYNPEPGKKLPENKFSILLYAGTGGTLEMTAGVTRVDIPGPIERLVGAKIITGRKSRSLNATLLLFFKAAKGKESRAKEKSGGVYAVNFDLTTGQNITANNRIQLVSQSWIEREEVRPDQIRHRLVWDTPGESYWILTPGKERHDRNFKVARFSLGGAEALYPNQPGRRIMLRHGEPADDDNYESLYRSMSRWIVVDTSDLEDSFPQQKSLWTAGEKSTDEKVKKGKEKILFPQFETFLEQRAQERGPSFHEVVLVEEAHKQTFLRTIVKQLLRKQGFWSLNNQNFTLFALDPKVGDKEMRDEIDKIAKHGAGRNLLYANLGDMLQAQNIEVERLATQKSNDTEDSEENNENNENGNDKDDDKADESEATSGRRGKTAVVIENGETATESDADGEGEEDGDDVSFKTSMMMVLASEGDHLPLKHFRSKTKTGNRVPMLIIATPAEWRALQNNYEDETNAGVFNSFEVNSQFLTSTWSVWNPDSGKATEEVVKASQAPISADEYHVFPNLEKILLEAANKNVPAKHRLVVVPEELKPLVRRLVLARWATDTKAVLGPWNHANFDLALFQVNQTNLSQELIAENFEAMRGALRSRRPVLMGDMSDILKAGRPLSVSGPTGSFSVRDPAMGKTASSGLADDDQANSSITSRQVPHLMWWLTTEGRKVQPQKTKSWDIKQDAPEQIPMMIFASEQELAQMRTDTEFEQRFVDIEKQFAIEHLEVPSEETRQKLIDELFNNSKIAGLGYTFDHKNYNDAEARRQLVGMMVNRVEHIARGLNQEPTNAFLKAYLELRRQLTEDSRLRQERRIDSFFFERLYRRVFNMPLSFEILTKDDPLLKLKDPERAAIGLQERGYEGPTELKRQVLETVTSQTKGADDGRPVPSSTILYGSTSTGKTFLFKKLIEYMGLKLYDFSKPNDDQASAFIINLGTLLEKEDPANPGRLSVDKALQHLENFLALPQGLRGFVLIDDAHKGSPEVRKRFLQFMQGFFEAPGGMLRVHRMNERKEIVDIPVRNLNLFMTLNPQPDREIRDKFVDEYK